MITVEQVRVALMDCFDPEIPVSVVDLGLIYDIRLDGNDVEIDMTLTAPGCPMSTPIARSVRSAAEKLEGVGDVRVRMVWDPPWTPAKMSPEAKSRLGFSDQQREEEDIGGNRA